MPVDRSLPLALVFGLLVGGLVYQFIVPDWQPALSAATIYAGAAYFYLDYDLSLFDRRIEFSDRSDKLGYAIGLFGLIVSPVALGEYVGLSDSTFPGLLVWVLGTITFLVFSMTAAQQGNQ